VNNAGVCIPKAFTDYTEEDYNLVINTNVASFFYMTRQVISQMKKQDAGHVVNISAVIADQPSSGQFWLYCRSRRCRRLVRHWHWSTRRTISDSIRFSPGVVNTPMHTQENHAALAKFHPLDRMGEVSDIVDAVLYLQNATFVTGENIRVD